mmetsp:Transcript_22329/g.56350  ORF Transcript_22329/g.56350 Transcript_22329/m.56350 type:complete len:309 (-) Transcript_22329:886-1812(-)
MVYKDAPTSGGTAEVLSSSRARTGRRARTRAMLNRCSSPGDRSCSQSSSRSQSPPARSHRSARPTACSSQRSWAGDTASEADWLRAPLEGYSSWPTSVSAGASTPRCGRNITSSFGGSSARPALALHSSASARSSVDLPQPEGPTTRRCSPARRCTSRPATAGTAAGVSTQRECSASSGSEPRGRCSQRSLPPCWAARGQADGTSGSEGAAAGVRASRAVSASAPFRKAADSCSARCSASSGASVTMVAGYTRVPCTGCEMTSQTPVLSFSKPRSDAAPRASLYAPPCWPYNAKPVLGSTAFAQCPPC